MANLTISLVQANLTWEDPSANRKHLEEMIRSIKERTEVVFLPEMFSTGFSMEPVRLAEAMDGPTVQWMRSLSAEKKCILCGSIIIKEEKGGDIKYFNRLIWMLPTGELGFYDKRHRFGFAGEDEEYTAGSKRLIASVKGWRINLLICYDLRFPVWARQSSSAEMPEQPEFDLLVYVANWPERRSLAWKTLLQARAIENQCYVVGVNRVGEDGKQIHYAGNSRVIDPLGEILYDKQETEQVHTMTLDRVHLDDVRAKFPFWKDGDRFSIIQE